MTEKLKPLTDFIAGEAIDDALAKTEKYPNMKRARLKPMSAQSIYHRITKVTACGLGRPLNPHLFRDCLATTWADEDPRYARGAAALLGQRSFRMTERHYQHAETRRASRSYVRTIASLRRELRKGA